MNAINRTIGCIAILLSWCVTPATAEEFKLHSFKKLQLSDVFFCEGATFGDVNRDGIMDLVSGPYWYAGPSFADRREYYEPKPYDTKGFSDNFFAFVHDINEDGWNDIVIVGFPGKEAWWFVNPQGKAGHWTRHLILDVVDGESPTLTNLTGDERPEFICNHAGCVGYAEMPKDDPTQPWKFRPISEDRKYQRFTHGMGVGDLNQDGRLDVMQKEGWWEQPPDGAAGQLWKFHAVDFAIPREPPARKGGAQMYAVDLDGDGDNDVVTSKDAHGYGLAWFENVGQEGDEIQYREHLIMGAKPGENDFRVVVSHLHAVDIADIDRDGVPDIITGRRGNPNGPSALYWFQTKRDGGKVRFVPHRIDMQSGVGTQVVVGDFSGDKWADIVVGNKRGTFAFTHDVEEVDRQTWEAAQPQPAAGKASVSATISPQTNEERLTN
jgi:hypothetical protein